jgi:hypothetical protein
MVFTPVAALRELRRAADPSWAVDWLRIQRLQRG